jgi:predicted oxidoreductase
MGGIHMKTLQLGTSDLHAKEIGLGLMRLSEKSPQEAEAIIQNALDLGVNFFDHADIYGGGKSEEVFREAFKHVSANREDILLQSKCGIRKGFFDFSKEHILTSTEGILKRLDTDYLDVLLLHRPDALVEPEEVAEAFTQLKQEEKVKYFGVSNHHPMQIELLKKYLQEDLIVNQVQFSLMHTPMIDFGLNVNMTNENGQNRDQAIIEYSRLNDMTIQAWSPFQYGLIKGTFLNNPDFPEINQALNDMAEAKGISNTTLATAWILRHPAHIQPIVGTMNTERLKQITAASEVELTREEWYHLYQKAGNMLP